MCSKPLATMENYDEEYNNNYEDGNGRLCYNPEPHLSQWENLNIEEFVFSSGKGPKHVADVGILNQDTPGFVDRFVHQPPDLAVPFGIEMKHDGKYIVTFYLPKTYHNAAREGPRFISESPLLLSYIDFRFAIEQKIHCVVSKYRNETSSSFSLTSQPLEYTGGMFHRVTLNINSPMNNQMCFGAHITSSSRLFLRSNNILTPITIASAPRGHYVQVVLKANYVWMVGKLYGLQYIVVKMVFLDHITPLSPSVLPLAVPDEEDADEGEDTCKICLVKRVNAVVVPCGHLSFCMKCISDHRRTNAKCPVCRQNITKIVRVFKS